MASTSSGAASEPSRRARVISLLAISLAFLLAGCSESASHLEERSVVWPDGKPSAKFSLKPAADHLAALLGKPVQFAPDCVGQAAADMAKALKPGGVLVYSTCSFAPEENECIVHAALHKLGDAVEVTPVDIPVLHQPGLTEWDGKTLNPQLAHSVRVLPDSLVDGFYLARLVKQRSTQ